jgi:membrane protein DedA with SNARE-associated domain
MFAFSSTLASPLWTWIHRLGGPGLILLGIIDNSAIPVPGSMDLFVVVLSSHNQQWWFYYALMATVGAVVGGFITYRLAKKGGRETLEKKIGKKKAAKVYRWFKHGGFFAVAAGASLPPPFPTFPVLLTAGALQYPAKNFTAALATGRGVRYFALAYLGRVYGRAIVHWFARYYQPFLYVLIALAILAGIGIAIYFLWRRARKQRGARIAA